MIDRLLKRKIKLLCSCVIVFFSMLAFAGCRAYFGIGYPINPKIKVEKHSFSGGVEISSSWTYVTITQNTNLTKLHKLIYYGSTNEVRLHLDWRSYDGFCVAEGNTIELLTKSGKIHTLYCSKNECAENVLKRTEYGTVETGAYNIYLIYEGDFSFLETDDYIQQVRIQDDLGEYYTYNVKGFQEKTLNQAYQKILKAIDKEYDNVK